MTAIVLKVMIALASGLLGAWMLRSRVMELPECVFVRWAVGLQLVPAVVLFVVLYVLGHREPTSDVPAFYLPEAHAVLAGKVPFRDFVSSYAPLFSYVGAALLSLWDSGKTFALFDTALNAATLVLWHESAKVCFDQRTARAASVLFATSGHVIVQGLLGTNQSWVAAPVAASTLMILREHAAASGLIQAIAACTTKLLTHLFWPVFWIFTPRRSRWLLAAVLPTAALYLLFVSLGAGPNLLHPLQYEATLRSSGNLPYILDLFLQAVGTSERVILDALAATALGVSLLWLFLRTRTIAAGPRATLLPGALALVGLTLMIFSKKSFTGYIVFVMYPLVSMLVAGPRSGDETTRPPTAARVGFLLVFNVLLVAEPSLWFHLDGYHYNLPEWLAAGGSWAAVGFVGWDLALLACYVYLAWLSARWVQITVDGAMAERKATQSETACSVV